MQSLNKLIQGEKVQSILTNTSNLENSTPVLDWNFFLNKMEILEAQKRDKIPAETLMAWFNTLKANSWNNERLEKQISVMLKNVTFGSIKIEDFFNSEEKFTREEMELKITQRINGLIQEGKRILQAESVEINKIAVSVAVAKRLKVYYNEEVDSNATEIINETVLEVAEKLGFKKVEYNNQVLSRSENLRAKLGLK